MRSFLVIGTLALLAAGSAQAALHPSTEPLGVQPDCVPAAGLEDGCSAEIVDEVALAAELLYQAMGARAVSFARERAAKLADDDDFEAADLWRRIAAAAAELAARSLLRVSPR
jgi:hypothetical protein